MIDEITRLRREQRDELLRWYATLGETERVQVHKLQTDLLRQLRESLRDRGATMPEASYCVLLIALSRRRSTLDAIDRKAELTREQAETITQMRVASILGQREQRSEGATARFIRVQLWPVIHRLREEHGLSWREIANYVTRYHKKRISHAYLRQEYTRILEGKRQRGEI